MRGKFNFSGICGQEINKNVLLCPICRVRFELLKQFQKEIKEFQEELRINKDDNHNLNFNEIVSVIKRRFGDLK
jgi:hypothetical protein